MIEGQWEGRTAGKGWGLLELGWEQFRLGT